MTSSEHMYVQELAAVVISRLLSTARTLNNSNVSTMVAEMGGVPPLVRHLRDGSPHASAHHGALSSPHDRCDFCGTAPRRDSSRLHVPSPRCADDL